MFSPILQRAWPALRETLRAPARQQRAFATLLPQAPISRLLTLNDLRDNPGAVKKRKRVGRGPGSGLGKTCGRGMKGTYSKHSLGKRGFEGGQLKLWKATPKKGAKKDPKYIRTLTTFTMDKLLIWLRMGRLDSSKPITTKALWDSGILTSSMIKHGVKLTGSGKAFVKDFPKLGIPVPQLELADVTDKARAAVEAVGGSVELVWMARVPLRAHLLPHKFDILPRGNGIPPRKYRAKYGYVFPTDRIYTGDEKKKQFPSRFEGLNNDETNQAVAKRIKDSIIIPKNVE